MSPALSGLGQAFHHGGILSRVSRSKSEFILLWVGGPGLASYVPGPVIVSQTLGFSSRWKCLCGLRRWDSLPHQLVLALFPPVILICLVTMADMHLMLVNPERNLRALGSEEVLRSLCPVTTGLSRSQQVSSELRFQVSQAWL